MSTSLTWLGIIACVSQSSLFSGLNLAFFSISRLELEVEAKNGSAYANNILRLRNDSNFLLTTILWGNVGSNVLLTLFSNSTMAGISAFVFSTVIITFLGEICPQAYFSRNAFRMASIMSPMVRFYQFVLFPLAKPTAMVLDAWLGKESIVFFHEKSLKNLILAHVAEETAEVDQVEGLGAINFLSIDDIFVSMEGETIDDDSIISVPSKNGFPIIPKIFNSVNDPFLKQINVSGRSWVILTDLEGEPLLIVDADACLRDAMFSTGKTYNFYDYCHRPLLVRDPHTPLGELIYLLKIREHDDKTIDKVIDNDVILLWSSEKRIITGADLLGRLLKGISTKK